RLELCDGCFGAALDEHNEHEIYIVSFSDQRELASTRTCQGLVVAKFGPIPAIDDTLAFDISQREILFSAVLPKAESTSPFSRESLEVLKSVAIPLEQNAWFSEICIG